MFGGLKLGSVADAMIEAFDLMKKFELCFSFPDDDTGLDLGVGHPLLLLYDAKTPRSQKINEFNGLGDGLFNASLSLF